jgi:type VI secretion system protein ImpF
MTRFVGHTPFKASVLDRLIHQNDHTGAAATGQSVREVKQSIRRDLENLLNTRWRCSVWPPTLNELDKSVVNYGIPDFSGAGFGALTRRQDFRKIIEQAIRTFEPRLKNVRVELIESDEPLDRVLRFRINAVLPMKPAPETVVFDSSLEPISSSFQVKGSTR